MMIIDGYDGNGIVICFISFISLCCCFFFFSCVFIEAKKERILDPHQDCFLIILKKK